MDSPFVKYAKAVVALESQLETHAIVAPLGLVGAIASHFLRFRYKTHGWATNPLSYAIQVEGREFDRKKLQSVMGYAAAMDRKAYALDFQANEDLMHGLKEAAGADNGNSGKFFYCSLFDPRQVADIRGSTENLSGAELASFRWFSSMPKGLTLIKKVGNTWDYSGLTSARLNRLHHVTTVKNYIRKTSF